MNSCPALRLLVSLIAGASVLVPAHLSAQPKDIHLRNETIHTSRTPEPAAAAGRAVTTASHLFLLQFTGPIDAGQRVQLEALGIDLLQYVPDDAYVVRMNETPPGQLRQLAFVQWVGPYRPEHKLHNALRAQSLAATRGTNQVEVTVLLAPRAPPPEFAGARSLLSRLTQESRMRFGTVLRGSIDPARLGALAQSDAVLWIEPAPRMRLKDEVASKIVGGDDGTTGTPTLTQQAGYDGRGVAVAVADSGLDTGDKQTMHPDLAGRVDAFFHYGALTDSSDEHSHGTHVAGIIAANAATGETDENGALYGLGVAPGAHLVVQRIFDGAGNFEAPPSFESLTRDALSAGAVIGNNSWGDDVQGRYDVSAAEFDELVRDADSLQPGDQPYILEFSAGNAGPGGGTIDSPAVAKNVIATGASQNNRDNLFIYAEGQEAMADFSSRGPCEDGRIKPDVVAPGTWISSVRSRLGNDANAWADISPNYMYQGGTSQSGPHVSGAAAVFVQYYRQVVGGTPSPALVKAALINSANDMIDEFGTDPAPNQDEGWGRVDLTRIIAGSRDCVFMDQTNLLTTGANYDTTVVVENGSEALKITLVYTDEPGFPGAIPALVNDLDLEVTAPDGTLYRGNQFLNGESIANPATPDSVNNVEGVHLLDPRPGEYRVRIHARNVAADARVDSPAVDQDFALVLSGKFLPAGRSVIYLDRDVYRAPDRINVGVVDRDLAGAASVTVTLVSGAEPGGENLTLLPKTPSGVFTNSILTVAGANPAGQLEVAHGDVIEARYNDVSAATVRTATAHVDLLPPVISAVTVTNHFGRGQVVWTTDEPADSRVDFGTNAALGNVASNSDFATQHAISLENLVAGATYFFRVVSVDPAGNAATNSNGGTLFSFVAPAAPPVLIVNGFFDDLLFDPPPPLSRYTDCLNELQVPFDVWDRSSSGPPAAADLRPYRVVIWRVPEFNVTIYSTLTADERQAITNYLNEGGSMFIASMELLSRLGEASGERFRTNVLKVDAFTADVTIASASGTPGDVIGNGMSLTLDYDTDYLGYDFSDTIVPGTDAAGIFTDDATGDYAGLRYPRNGVDSAGRLVFLSFPFEAVAGPAPNDRTELLRRILQFLAPGLNGEAAVALDRPAYTLPSQVLVELGDADLAGAGQANVTASTTTEPAGQTLVLQETSRPGLFRGVITLVNATNPPATGRLRGSAGDQIAIRYQDASSGKTVEQVAVIDVVPPQISAVQSEPDYSTATISWSTDEPADALVQFGESLPLPNNRTAFDPVLKYDHTLALAGLQPDRTYFYRVVSRDGAGNAATEDNAGQFYTFRTLKPLTVPFTDHFETGATNWSVFSSDESETHWTLGVPQNGVETAAHSPTSAWGSSINGAPVSIVDTFLISPAIQLTNGNRITLRFWHSYDFTERSQYDILEGGELLLVENDTSQTATLATYFNANDGWEQEEIDLTPYLGKIVYFVWHHQLLSLDNLPRPGWLVDDVEIVGDTIVAGTVVVTNNLSQATFALTGPAARSGAGRLLAITNAPPGQYVVTFGTVPFYSTPAAQTNLLAQGGTIQFNGIYSFPDSNGNGISDLWEQQFLGSVPPVSPPSADSDGDGMSNYAEFIAGTNPTNAASGLWVSAALQPNNLFRLEWPTVPGRDYRLLSSTDMAQWSPVTSWMRAAGSTLSQLLQPGGSATLYRIEVRP